MKDVMAIHTQGLDYGIRCAMCTNSMKSDRGCDGGCIVDDEIYKRVMNTINNHIFKQEPCEDAISRQAAIDLIADYDLSMGEVVKGIHNLPSITPQQTRWIPVSERLPEEFQRVLVIIVNYNGDKIVRVAEYHSWNGEFQIKENHEQWKVGEKGLLAWMPLPEPYTESEE